MPLLIGPFMSRMQSLGVLFLPLPILPPTFVFFHLPPPSMWRMPFLRGLASSVHKSTCALVSLLK